DTLAVGVLAGRGLTPAAQALDRELGGALARAARSGRFDGTRGQVLDVLAPAGRKGTTFAAARVTLLGLGAASALTPLAAQEIGGALAAHLGTVGESRAVLALDLPRGKAPITPAELTAHAVFGAALRAYRFDRYRSGTPSDAP